MSQTIEITDEAENHRFVHHADGVDAQLVYKVDGDRLILIHTEVPEALGGRGIAGELVQAAVERAVRTHETVLPWCPYARRWLENHPDQASRIAIDWSPPPRA